MLKRIVLATLVMGAFAFTALKPIEADAHCGRRHRSAYYHSHSHYYAAPPVISYRTYYPSYYNGYFGFGFGPGAYVGSFCW